MTGIQEYNKYFSNKIQRTLKNQPDYIRGYVNSMTNVSITTRHVYMLDVIKFMKTINKPAEKLTYDDFLSYLSEIQYKKNGELTTASYRIAVYSSLRKFSNYLYTTKRISEDYMLNIKKPKAFESQKTIEKRNKGYLTEDEINILMDTLEESKSNEKRIISEDWNLRDKLIIKIFLLTGIRCSALAKIDVKDIDIENHTLIVTDKGDKVRLFNLPENLFNDIEKWLKIREEKLNGTEENALFISNQKRRIACSSVSNITTKYGKKITGKHITPHKLRATYGTQLYNKTKDIYFVQTCMGHVNPKTTELYVRGNKDNTKKASNIMFELIE